MVVATGADAIGCANSRRTRLTVFFGRVGISMHACELGFRLGMSFPSHLYNVKIEKLNRKQAIKIKVSYRLALSCYCQSYAMLGRLEEVVGSQYPPARLDLLWRRRRRRLSERLDALRIGPFRKNKAGIVEDGVGLIFLARKGHLK